MLASAVIWCTITSGCASLTASSTARRSRPSTMTGVAPAACNAAALAVERVVPVTSWPAATRLGTRYWPIAPVAPATKTRMISYPFLRRVFLCPLRRSHPRGRDTTSAFIFLLGPALVPGTRDRAQVAQLLRVGDRPDSQYLAAEHVEHDDRAQVAVGVASQHARLPVHPGGAERCAQLHGPLETDADDLGHLVAAEHRGNERRLALAAAVAVEHDVRSQSLEKAGHVAAVRRGQEQCGELITLGPGRLEPRPSLVDAAAGPGEGLSARGLGLAGDAGDVAVVVAEYLAEQEHGPFGRGQALQQHQERHRQGVGGLGEFGRIGVAP